MVPEANLRGGAGVVRGDGMLDALLKLVVELPGRVIHRGHVGVPNYVLDEMGCSSSGGVEPVVLRRGDLSTDHARDLVEQAVEGTPFAINVFGSVDVLFDRRWTYNQAMMIDDRLKVVDNPLLLDNEAPLCVLQTKLVWVLLQGKNEKSRRHAAAVVGLLQDQLDFVLLGNGYQRLRRLVIIAAQETARGHKEHPAVRKFQDRVGRLVLSSA
jgi:hypothetical protein